VNLSDMAIARLRRVDDRPDVSATHYELLDEIGRGGMGIVFRARDRELDRDVAIKVTAWRTDADAARLRREARTLASLEHAGIVPVHDVGRLPDGRMFIVMGLVRGERLDVHARGLALADRLRLFDRICDTVAFAHARGVVHRDLTPANVMVGSFGQVQIVDWGLATPYVDSDPFGAAPAEKGQTPKPAADVAGTDGYMAPEQRTQKPDARADVYALGAILAGLIADPGDQNLPASLRRPLHSIAARANSSDPAARYPDAAELAADVRRFVDGQAVLAHRETGMERIARFGRTYRTPIVLVLTYLVVRIVLLVWRV
jgi:eukaryotic-like serine/threonine-protein kinase